MTWLVWSSRPTEISAEPETGPGTVGAVAGWTEAVTGQGWDPQAEGSWKTAAAAGKTEGSEQSSAAVEVAGKTAAAAAEGRIVGVAEVAGEQTAEVAVEG